MSTYEELLIQEVYLRPFLYNKYDPSYKKRTIVANGWSEVAKKIEKSVADTKKRWRSLKDTFQKEFKKLPSGSGAEQEMEITWPWYHQMKFLKEVNLPLPTEDNLEVYEVYEIQHHHDAERNEIEIADSIAVANSEGSHMQQNLADTLIESNTERNETSVLLEKTPSVGISTPSTPSNSKTFKKAKVTNKDSMEDKWSKVIDKISAAAETQNGMEETETAASLFGKYITKEMEKLSEDDQDDFKFSVFQCLRDAKKRKHN